MDLVVPGCRGTLAGKSQSGMKSTLITVAVAAAGLLVWLATEGWLVPPMARGAPRVTVSRHSNPRYSLRTMFVATTLAAILLGLGVWLAS